MNKNKTYIVEKKRHTNGQDSWFFTLPTGECWYKMSAEGTSVFINDDMDECIQMFRKPLPNNPYIEKPNEVRLTVFKWNEDEYHQRNSAVARLISINEVEKFYPNTCKFLNLGLESLRRYYPDIKVTDWD